jgi:hypothetical protein
MGTELIKVYGPAVYVVFLLLYLRKRRSIGNVLVAVFLVSFAACSQNFVGAYRDIHQAVQAALALVAVLALLRSGQVPRFNLVFMMLLGFITVSLLFAPFDADAQLQFVNVLVAIGVVNCLYLASKRDLRHSIDSLGNVATLTAALGLIHFGADFPVRAEATFSNPNYFAFFLGLGFCAVYTRPPSLRRSGALVMILCALVASGSLSALVFPLLQVAWSLAAGRRKGAVLYVVIGGIALILAIASGRTRLSAHEEVSASRAERVVFASVAVRMANERPLTGVGWGRYIAEFGEFSTTAEDVVTATATIDLSAQERRVTHNDYLRILAELGWPAFVIALAYTLWTLAALIVARGWGAEYLLAVWLGTVLFSTTHNNLNTAMFWFVFLLPAYLSTRTQVKKPHDRGDLVAVSEPRSSSEYSRALSSK